MRSPAVPILMLMLALSPIPEAWCAAAESGERELQRIDMQLRWRHQFQFAGYYAALEKGYYREAGLDVHLHEGAPGRLPVREVLEDRAQYAEGNSEVLFARLNGAPLVALAAIFQHSPSVLIARADSNIRTPQDMIGKTVMHMSDESDADYRAMFLKEAIKLSDVNLVPSSYDISDLANGKVAVFNSYLTNEPFYLKERGIDFTVINPKNYGIDFYSDVLFTSERELHEHPQRVKAFLRATLKGWRYAMDHPDEIIDLLLNKYHVGKSRTHLLFEANAMRELILPDLIEIGHMNPERWRHMADTFVTTGMANKDYSLQGFLYETNPGQEIENLWRVVFIVSIAAGLFIALTAALIALQRRLKKEIQEHKQAEREIKNFAFYDPLTKLPNRRLLFERLQQALMQSARRQNFGAVLFLDLDNFKVLNDTRGHDIGDLLLIEVALRLQSCVRQEDTVARLGGDEFVVMLENLGKVREEAAGSAQKVAAKVLTALSRPYILNGQEFSSSSSIGVCLFIDEETPGDLLKRSDTAMYHAKSDGRNTLRFFDPEMQASLEERCRFEAEIRYALINGGFWLHFQVQVDAQRRPVAVEALLRWTHPRLGLLLPQQFLPLAEESGLSADIGRWVLETACAQLSEWQWRWRDWDFTLAVNICPRQFCRPEFATHVEAALHSSGADPRGLMLELNEKSLLDDLDDAVDKMHSLKNLGVKFSLDDFGTGPSSFSVVKTAPLDQLKIDISLIQGLTKDHRAEIAVKAIINMAHTLGLHIVAEGVENEAQLEFLMQNGCRNFQGYLFGELDLDGLFGNFPEWNGDKALSLSIPVTA